ncbi:MAG: hypothetical protein ABIK62_07000, partial [candidate division WOR-3 bacterium]
MRKCLLAVVVTFTVGWAEALPSLEDTVRIQDWLLAGPFLAGVREGIPGAFADPAHFCPSLGDSYRTPLVQGGKAPVKRLQIDSLGWLDIK